MNVINVINVHYDGKEAMHIQLASMVQQRPSPSIELITERFFGEPKQFFLWHRYKTPFWNLYF